MGLLEGALNPLLVLKSKDQRLSLPLRQRCAAKPPTLALPLCLSHQAPHGSRGATPCSSTQRLTVSHRHTGQSQGPEMKRTEQTTGRGKENPVWASPSQKAPGSGGPWAMLM